MSDSVLTKLSVELEAKMEKLDRKLEEAEKKAQRSGEKMEGSLSLGGVASKMVQIFAALGTIEAGFRGVTAVTELLDGNLSAALDSIERMPFGIGPAVAAGRDFFEVVSGSREEAERLVREWGKVAEAVRTAQSEVNKLIQEQADADKTGLDRINEQSQRINELNRQYTDFINEIIKLQEKDANTPKASPESLLFGLVGATVSIARHTPRIDPLLKLPDDLEQRLQDIGIEANTAAEAIEILRQKVEETFQAGERARAEELAEILSRVEQINQQAFRENLQDLGTENNADLELRRFEARLEFEKRLAAARDEIEEQAIRDLFDTRLALIEREAERRRQLAEQAIREEEERREEFLRRRKEAERREEEKAEKERQREAEQMEKDRFVEGRGIAADEFLRTSFQGGDLGKPQEVNDPEVLDAVRAVGDTAIDIARRVGNITATLS